MDSFDLFSTPLFVHRIEGQEALQRGLADQLIAESRQTPGVQRSNQNAWHSVPDLTLRQEAPFQQVAQLVVAKVEQSVFSLCNERGQPSPGPYRYGLHGWAMVMEAGGYASLHDHAEAHWSAVYYLDSGESSSDEGSSAGSIEFFDPRGARPMIPGVEVDGSAFLVRPSTGMLIVFPGYLPHFVHPYQGKRPRVCLSYNVQMNLVPAS